MLTPARFIDRSPSSANGLHSGTLFTPRGRVEDDLLLVGNVLGSPTDTKPRSLSDKLVAGTGVTLVPSVHPTLGTQLTINSASSSSVQTNYNTVSRYAVVSTTGVGVEVTSSSPYVQGLNWSRTTTTLTLTQVAHSRVVGERVIVRDTNVDYQVALVTASTTNTFTITTTDVGATSGTAAAYSLGFTFAHTGSPITGGTLIAPAASTASLVLLSLRMHLAANTRSTTTYSLTVPRSSSNGAGDNVSNDGLWWPQFMVRQDADTMAAVAATLAKNVGTLATFQLANLGLATTGLMIALQF